MGPLGPVVDNLADNHASDVAANMMPWQQQQHTQISSIKKTFTLVGVPGCKPGATLVSETRVAAAQHVYSMYIVSTQSLYVGLRNRFLSDSV